MDCRLRRVEATQLISLKIFSEPLNAPEGCRQRAADIKDGPPEPRCRAPRRRHPLSRPNPLKIQFPTIIMFSADDPFVPLPPGAARRFITESPLTEAEQAKIAHGNWERLTRRG